MYVLPGADCRRVRCGPDLAVLVIHHLLHVAFRDHRSTVPKIQEACSRTEKAVLKAMHTHIMILIVIQFANMRSMLLIELSVSAKTA